MNNFQQGREDDVGIEHRRELAEQGLIRQGDIPLIFLQHLKPCVHRSYGGMRAAADADAAVDAALIEDLRLPLPHPDRLVGAGLDTGGTAHTL